MERQEAEIKKHNRRQNIISAAILIVGIAASLIIFGPKSHSQKNNGNNESAVTVKAVELKGEAGNFASLKKTVIMDPINSAAVVSEYTGRIKEVNFKVGDYVNEGKVLAVFDQSEINNNAKISLEFAQRTYNLSKNNYEETKIIAEESIELAKGAVKIAEENYKKAKDGDDDSAKKIAKESLEIAEDQKDQAEAAAEAQINGAKIQLEQANFQLEQARIGYDKTFIKAPISGWVVSQNISKEDYLGPGQLVAQIAKDGRLETKIYLNDSEISKIQSKDEVKIFAGEKEYAGEIYSFSPVAGSINQRHEVVVRTKENVLEIANKSVEIELSLRLEGEKTFFVPLDAVSIGQNMNKVFIVDENNRAKAVTVEIKEIIGEQAEVTNLNEGDKLVVEGNKRLTDGQLIKIID